MSLSGPNVLGSVENVHLQGTSAINAAGNQLDNLLFGNSANNDLMGLGGNDTLVGAGGADNFVFNAALNAATNVDTINDFSVPADTIRLENAFFPALTTTGTLAASAFHIGAGAHDADDRVIYNNTSGALSYDADGTGSVGAIQFATLDPNLPVTNADFFIV
jgi:Ca2+-binding RTX toxin-like protein